MSPVEGMGRREPGCPGRERQRPLAQEVTTEPIAGGSDPGFEVTIYPGVVCRRKHEAARRLVRLLIWNPKRDTQIAEACEKARTGLPGPVPRSGAPMPSTMAGGSGSPTGSVAERT